MLLIVGLGNPGKKYTGTRHNIGFMVIDMIHQNLNFPVFKAKFKGQYSNKKVLNTNVLLLKPNTYMNLSGLSVKTCKDFFKIDLSNIIVFHDDLDMQFLKIRVKTSGGHGGHNGIKNIKEHIGENFCRIKLGIRNREVIENVNNFVLGDFSKDECLNLKLTLDKIVKNLHYLINKEFIKFSSNTNHGF